MNFIKIKGARQHNLKNINLEIPKNKLVVITGLSGSGKSSLAFDTIYAEGQRRYVESLSTYARQFLEQMEKPDVDSIEGLSPAIAIQQRTPSRNPRSTVGTVTEIYDYLRLLYSKAGIQHCVRCHRPVKSWSAHGIVADILSKLENSEIKIFSPLISGRIGTYEELFLRLKKNGFYKVRVDGKVFELGGAKSPSLHRYVKHTIELFIDELKVIAEEKERLYESVELALNQSKGFVIIETEKKKDNSFFYSEKNACPACGISYQEPEPRFFSFNSPYGACPECGGLGIKIEIDPDMVVPDKTISINKGAITAWSNPVTTRTHRWKNSWSDYYTGMVESIAGANSIPLDVPWKEIAKEKQEILLFGDSANDFEGVMPNLKRRYERTESEYVKEEIYRRFMHEATCRTCKGRRLRKESLGVLIHNKNISDLSALSIEEIRQFIHKLVFSEKEKVITKQIIKEIISRLNFLIDVGLSYVTLDRKSETLSGGEAQRIQLATQIGSGLTGVLYVLDEPTIGLHQKDNAKLINTLKSLRDIGNTLIVVEHDEAVIRNSDHIIDLGPGAGLAGGKITAQGNLQDILKTRASLTGQFLKGERKVLFEHTPRRPCGKFLEFKHAAQFNLKNIDVKIPLGLFIAMCGVSGSGKSTLLYEIIYKALAKKIYKSKESPGKFLSMKGTENIDKVVIIDQSPIGRTPRSNPATYSGVFGHIRQIFSELPESKRRGYKPGRFSFNVKGGRCQACQGDGMLKIQMQFLPDVYVKCEECHGKRFNEETMEVRFKNKNISEVLEMSVSEAKELFSNLPGISKILATMSDVGLDYIKLGQSATTLSGGEAQRLKLAEQLCRKQTGKTLYLLDEPTTGLHFADVEKLLKVLHKLVDEQNTVLIIEHNLDVIASSDWAIELGPEGGQKGGEIIFSGCTRELLNSKASITGAYLKEHIKGEKASRRLEIRVKIS